MKTKVLFAILTWVNLLLVEGLESNITNKNPDHNTTRRILHGIPAVVTDFPFLVKLDTAGALGAGAIITEYWILTAGHCVYQRVCSEVMKIFPAVWEPGQSIDPVECYAHPQYTNLINAYDIGLIKVQENLLQDGRTKGIPLPAPGTVHPPGTQVVIAGWGLTETNQVSNELLRGDFRVEEWDYCNNMHLEHACDNIPRCIPRGLPRRALCVQGLGVPAAGTCFGDSGGPAIIDGFVAGLVSFGLTRTEMCNLGAPSIVTRVIDYLPWIYSYIDPEMDTSGMQVEPEPEY